jgi:hypothetical protein
VLDSHGDHYRGKALPRKGYRPRPAQR